MTGATGQVGHALAARLRRHELLLPGRAELDLASPAAIAAYIDRERPDLIINPAAYTAVDKAESEAEAARLVNAEAPKALAQAAARHGIALVHFSTDYVFDGSKDAPYVETDATGPMSVYGRTKLDGELAIAQSGCSAWILRTSWVFGTHGGNFMKTILRLAQERDKLSIVNDQWGAPTSSQTIADALATMLERNPGAEDAQGIAAHIHASAGIYHLTCGGQTNWHQYARRVVDAMPALGLTPRVAAADIAGIPTDAYPTPARRPKNSRLATVKLERTFNLVLPTWEFALDQCLRELARQP
nr:dTDP-4-dehydrorhamnose reductase [Herbaspirillum sp. LeCh32-8]